MCVGGPSGGLKRAQRQMCFSCSHDIQNVQPLSVPVPVFVLWWMSMDSRLLLHIRVEDGPGLGMLSFNIFRARALY